MFAKIMFGRLLILFLLGSILFSCEEEIALNQACTPTADGEVAWVNNLISDLETEDRLWNNLGSFSINGSVYFMIGNCNPVINYAPSYLDCSGNKVGTDFIIEELDKEGGTDISKIFSRLTYIWCGEQCDC